MKPRRPINQDVPAPESPQPEKNGAPAEKKREPKPLAPKLLAALVVLALIFIVVAIVAGGSGGDSSAGGAPASTPPSSSDSSSQTPASAGSEALGFPSIATNNTTRVGGPNPTSNAAAVALAVFPSTTPAQRPRAVTLVDQEDWAGAIAASVLMAAPVSAPVLFSAPDALPKPTADALEALDPQGAKATGGASYFTVGSVAVPDGAGKITRIDAGDPAATAAQIVNLRERLFKSPPEHIIVAPVEFPEYAMPAAAWAARSGDPVLFTDTKKLSPPTLAILKSHPKASVYVMGPSEVVSLRAIGEIGQAVHGDVGRMLGPGPGDSTLTFTRRTWGTFGWGINDPGHGFVIVNGETPANAAAAAALSASGTWGPLLLTKDPDRLPVKVRSYLLDVKPGYSKNPTRAVYNHVWLVGDEEEISVAQQAEVNELAELTKINGGE